jgi:subtilisin family serine protease
MGTPVDAYYTSASGTSMATPHAAGASALLLQALPGLTPEQVKARLMGSAIDLGLDSNTQGSGRGDILAAYEYGGGTPPPPTPPPPEPQPGGCNPFASSQRTEAGEVRTGVAKEFWWILGILLVLCICVTCATATLLAIALTTS